MPGLLCWLEGLWARRVAPVGLLCVVLAALVTVGCRPAQIGMSSDGGVTRDGAVSCVAGEGSLGEACTCDEGCGVSAPRCTRDRLLEPEGASYCTLGCAADPASCPLGYECTEGASSGGAPFCARCASETPGVVPLGELCLCDADCEGLASCGEGTCRVADCLVSDPSSCPEGFGCEAGPGFATYCAECVAVGGVPAAEGQPCGCSAECEAGLVCRRGACSAPCELEEECGARSCIHRTTETASCQDPILDCIASGGSGPGGACDCNADCGADAPICLLGSLGDVAIDRCVRGCVPDAGDCPAGTQCCGADRVLAPTCLPDDVVGALGSMIQCAG